MLAEPAPAAQSGLSSEQYPWIPSKSRRPLLMELLGYAIAVTVTMLLFLSLFRVNSTERLHIPFIYAADGLYYLTIVKTIDETGWYYHNERIGQLGGLDYRAFPTSDGWAHYFIIVVILKLGFDPITTANLFYILTFPLTTISALFVCRRLGITYIVGLMVSLLFTFQPYHVARVMHPYLVATYFIPLAILLVIRIYQGRLPLRETDAEGRTRWKFHSLSALGALLIAILIGAGGVYYAFFSCFFFMVVGSARSYAERHFAPVMTAGILSFVVFVTLFITMWPSIEYKRTHPHNGDAPARWKFESETYGLKVVQMLMPVSSHRWRPLEEFKSNYNKEGTPLINENDASSLGIVGAVGFMILTIRLFLRRKSDYGTVIDGLALVMAAGVFLATIGGFGAVISWYISPWIRAYNRISIFIAFFALLTVGLLVDRYGRRWTKKPWDRAIFIIGVIGLTVIGYFDETNRLWVPRYDEIAYEVGIDRRFVEKVEAVAPQGGLVFQLPHGGYPETVFANGNQTYEMLRPYLYSEHLRWTYGSITGHYGNEWAKILTRSSTPELVEKLALAGVVGISVDRNGYLDNGNKIVAELNEVLGDQPIVSENYRHIYYDLTEYTAQMKSQFSASEWEVQQERAQHPIVPLCRNGFFYDESVQKDASVRPCRKSGEIHLNNDLGMTRSVQLRFYVTVPIHPTPSLLHIQAPNWDETLEVSTATRFVEHQMSLPPGLTVIQLKCNAESAYNYKDPKQGMVFVMTHLECVEEIPASSSTE